MIPFVSVILPVYNDPAGVSRVLRGLLQQTYLAGAYEIIVVDNGSGDETPDTVQRFQNQSEHVRLVIEDQIRSSYAARNKGIAHACGEIIAFTDADCRPEPDWLEKGVSSLLEAEAALAAGHIQMVFQPGGPNFVEFADASLYLDQRDNVERVGYGATANLFLRRDLFERHGPFRQDLQSGGDVEFGWRLTGAGEKLVYASDAIVFHPARSTIGAYLRKEKRVSLGHRRLRELGITEGFAITWRSFVPWARVPSLEGIDLTPWQKAGVRALLICVKYLRLAYKLMPSALVAREHSVKRVLL